MTDPIEFSEASARLKAKQEELAAEQNDEIFAELVRGFSIAAAAYLQARQPEIWADEQKCNAALSIATGLLCLGAYNNLMQIGRKQAGSRKEFNWLRMVFDSEIIEV